MDSEPDFLLKYAPTSIEDLLGASNRNIVRRLIRRPGQKKALVAGYGEGKTAITHLTAMGMACKESMERRPCGRCSSCLHILDRLRAAPSVLDWAPDGSAFWAIDCTRLRADEMGPITEYLTVYANCPHLVIFDEFHDANEDIQQRFLKLLELKLRCTVLFCFASVNSNNLTQALLQRLAPPLMPTRPGEEDFKPLLQRVMTCEEIELIDPEAAKMLIDVCGRVPRLVLKALEDVKADGEGLSVAVVQRIAARLRIVGEGREHTK